MKQSQDRNTPKLFFSNLDYKVQEQDLQDHIEDAGFPVAQLNIVMDRETGKSRGFAFVELQDVSANDEVIANLNAQKISGRTVYVALARPREPR